MNLVWNVEQTESDVLKFYISQKVYKKREMYVRSNSK